jgi:alkylated DNA repair dioxygenase AlkB
MPAHIQPSLFERDPSWPEGFVYEPDLISPSLEQGLIGHISSLPLKPFEFHGHLGHRRVASFGWRYDYGERRIASASPIPDFLLEVRALAAGFAGCPPASFEQILVTEYRPGAGIGWHRDKREFGQIVGLSLAAPCVLRLRRKEGAGWRRVSQSIEPRSAYGLAGPVRTEWEHSIPPVPALRYSITFRTIAAPAAAN